MKSKKYSLVVLSIFLVLLIFIGSASAAKDNETDVVSIDKSTNMVNEKLALDSSLDNAVSNDDNAVENNKEILQNSKSDEEVSGNKVNITGSEPTHRLADFMQEINDGAPSGYVKLKYNNYTYTGESFSPFIYNEITIDGNGATLDMKGLQSGVLFYTSAPIHIKNLTVKNANSYEDSCIVRSLSSDMGVSTIENCIFINNNGADSGIVAFDDWCSGSFNIKNCTFINNGGMNSNCVIHDEGSFEITVENCVFVNDISQGYIIYTKDAVKSIENNWWGSNNPNWNTVTNHAQIPSSFAVLNAVNNTITVNTGSKAKLIYAFYRNGTNDVLSIPARPIQLSSNGGKLDNLSGELINGEFSTEFSSDVEGVYVISANVDNEVVNITVNVVSSGQIPTEIISSPVTTVYNIDENIIITLKDGEGKPVSGVNIIVDLNGAKTYITDTNGQVIASTNGLIPKTYTAKITFEGNDNYKASSADVEVTVKKATPKLSAKKKTYRANAKTKKFTIVLKDNTGKPIKNAKVRLMIKKISKSSKKGESGKKSKSDKKKNFAVTNNKGKATFKVLRNKMGKYNAKVKFYSNEYYNKVTKTVKIIIK